MTCWNSRQVLVTGVDGFIGSHLTEKLLKAGAGVRALVHYNPFGRWGWLHEHAGDIDVRAGDVHDAERVAQVVEGVDVIFHLAALVGIPYSYEAPVTPMKPRLKAGLRRIVTWPPLNRILTGALKAILPQRLRAHPAIARYAPRTGTVDVELPGGGRLRMHSRGDDDIASPLFWRGWAGHKPETAQRFYELSGSARVTLRHRARRVLPLARAHANLAAHLYAVEPLARVRARLEHNVALNGAANVTCVPLAVGSPLGSAEFFHVREGIPSSSSLSGTFMRSIVSRDELTISTVEVVEVDQFVESRALIGVDLVKVDTETTEAAVFRGMRRTLGRDRPEIFCRSSTRPSQRPSKGS